MLYKACTPCPGNAQKSFPTLESRLLPQNCVKVTALCCRNAVVLLSNRHQFDSNSLTPAYPDAILESVEVIGRLMPNDLNRRCLEAATPHCGVGATYQRLATRFACRGPLGRREPAQRAN